MDFKVSLNKHIVCLIVMVCSLVPILTTNENLSLQTKLVYDCLSNGSINVINPEPEMLTEAHAHRSGKLCDVIFSYGFRRFIITDCEGLEPIYIKLYDPGGDRIIIDNLSCKRSHQGSNVDSRSSVDVSKTKSVQTGIQIQLPNGITIDKSPPTVNDTEMVLKDESGQIVKRHVYVGEALIWEIAIPTKRRYTLIPITCNATSDGTSSHFSTPEFTFIEKGCSLNKDLATHFHVQRDGYTRSWATLFAFRFRSSPLVIIHCVLHVCQEWDQKCNYNCVSIKRSSKDIGKFILHEPEELVVSMHMRVIEGYSQYEINRGRTSLE
ncbi:hypothetical protein CHS0354_007158, partial [Potamilus streckersoni]